MDALTPVRPVLRPSSGMNSVSAASRSPGFTHPAFRPFRLQPPAHAASRPGTLPVDGSHQDGFPTGLLPTGTRGFRHSLAGSPHHTGRIEFLIVRTGRSPPAASPPRVTTTQLQAITSYLNSIRVIVLYIWGINVGSSLCALPIGSTISGWRPKWGRCKADGPLLLRCRMVLARPTPCPTLAYNTANPGQSTRIDRSHCEGARGECERKLRGSSGPELQRPRP